MKELVLKEHQYEILEKIISGDIKKHILAMDTGTGKTIVGLSILNCLYEKSMRVLIICPPILIQNAWMGDNEEFKDFQMDIIPLDKKKIESNILSKPGIYITSYNMVQLYQPYFRKYMYDIILLDESHKICNRSSKTSRTIIGGWNKTNKTMEPGLKADRFYLLTGSLIPNKEEQIYQQLKGCGYDRSWTYFKKKYFLQPKQMLPYIIVFDEQMRDDFNDLVAKYTTVVKSDVTELDGISKRFHEIKFTPSKETMMYQNKTIKEQIVHINGVDITMDYLMTERAKLCQLARGFIKDETGINHDVSRTPYKLYEDFIGSRADKRPFIVWYNYPYELDMLKKMTKVKHWELCGGLTKKQQNERISEFKASDSGVLFIQYSVGKNGLTLTNSKDMVFFSLKDDAEAWEQAQARIHRIGQKHMQLDYYVFIGRGTIDEAIYSSIINKTNMLNTLKNWIINKGGEVK
jgi:ERCC4-related helicase